MSHAKTNPSPSQSANQYTVQVGHLEVVVEGCSPAEAIHSARLRLSNQLPRLYDVIHALTEDRFDVRLLPGTS